METAISPLFCWVCLNRQGEKTHNFQIYAPGLISAYERKDIYLKGAYVSHRFTGPKFPHIDPVKEATAARILLGTGMAHVPITNVKDQSEGLRLGS